MPADEKKALTRSFAAAPKTVCGLNLATALPDAQ
jgi:hypothetical protein